MRMLKRNTTVLPTASNNDSNNNNNNNNRYSMFQSMTLGRKKTLKILAIVAVMHCIHTMKNDTSSSMLRRATSTTSSAFDGKNNLPLELIQAVQQASLKDHLVGKPDPRSLLTQAHDIPLKNDGVDDKEAYKLGAWREKDGTNISREERRVADLEARSLEKNGATTGAGAVAAVSPDAAADANGNAKADKNDRGLLASFFGGKNVDNGKDQNESENPNAASDASAAANEMDANMKNVLMNMKPDQADLFSTMNSKAGSTMDMDMDMQSKSEAARLKMHSLDKTSIQNMNSGDLNALIQQLGINPDVLPKNIASEGAQAELAAVNSMQRQREKGASAELAAVDSMRLEAELELEANKKQDQHTNVMDRSHMVMPTPQELMTRAKDQSNMMASEGESPILDNVGTMFHSQRHHQPGSSNAYEIKAPPAQIQAQAHAVNPDLAALLQQYSGEDLAAALAQIQGGQVQAQIPGQGQGTVEQFQPLPQKQNANLPPPGCTKAPRIPAPKQEPLRPTMIASYPGSGARLSWKLIRAITGYMTSDDAVDTDDLSKKGVVVAIKSHYPAHGSTDEIFMPFAKVDRSVLLLRNPLKSMPSFLSYLYERENNLENHSTRVPLEKWIEWRDEHFQKELMSWVHHTLFWMEHNSKGNTLVISYENLVDKNSGPMEYAKLGGFLSESSGKKLAQSQDDIPCVWDFIVNSRGDTSTNGKTPQSHRSGPKVYPFTDEQIETIVHYLESLAKLYPDELGSLMEGYINDAFTLKEKLHSA
jgi:hypothetical protein